MTSYNLIAVPRTWMVAYISLCVLGVSNVSFIRQLPKGIRVVSAVYNLLVVICVIPIVTMFYLQSDWKQEVYVIAQRFCEGTVPLWLAVTAISLFIHGLPIGKIASLTKCWVSFQGKSASNAGKENHHANVKSFRISLTLLLIFCLTQACLTSFGTSKIEFDDYQQDKFPSFGNHTKVSEVISVMSLYLNQMSYLGQMSGICLYLLIIYAICGEFCDLRTQLEKCLMSAAPSDSDLETFRHRYETLIHMAAQSNTIFCAMLGATITQVMMVMCVTSYIIITAGANISVATSFMLSALMLWLIFTPAMLLTREVRAPSSCRI